VLTLLGVPAPARLIVDVHGALFDGDLTIGALGALLRDEQRDLGLPSAGHVPPYRLCLALKADGLTAARGLIALSTWPLAGRVVTAASVRVDALTAIVRVAEFAAVLGGASRSVGLLLRELAAAVPGGPESYDVMNPRSLADAARRALAGADADRAVRDAAAERAAQLDEKHQMFGLPAVPPQTRRGGSA
jgi:hypothetical protein